MTTTALKKTPVETKWTMEQVQQKAAMMQANIMLAAMTVLGKHGGEEAHKEFAKLTREHKVSYYKSIGVKTPLDLVKAMAEMDVNVLGSKVEIAGDDHKAELTYNHCAVWENMSKMGKFTPAQEEKMGAGMEACMSDLAKEFGFTAKVEHAGDVCSVIFTK